MNKYTTNKKYFESILSKNVSDVDISINSENTTTLNSFEYDKYIGFDIKSNTSSIICKHCNKSITRFKQYRITYPLYALYNSKSIMLKMRNKQYYCMDCKKHTTEKLFKI